MMCGLEIHVQLETESKLFCDCPTNFNEAPINQNICPICLNQPGAKPHPTNQHAIENGATSLLEPTTEPWGAKNLLYSRSGR